MRKLAISEMFRVYFFFVYIYIKDSTFVKGYITLSVRKNRFISVTVDWKTVKFRQVVLDLLS